jgi:ubiquinone/menaquinone biosynthesis C-methylase UbiE
MDNIIVDFYSNYDEQNRLLNRYSIERIRTQEIIQRYIQEKSLKILDIGGAAGIYSFWLAELGHSVDLIDLTPKHVIQAKEHEIKSGTKLSSIVVGNAIKLPYETNTYDIVLLMGPMYHILEVNKRIKSLKEARRVLKQDGIIFIAAISQYASLLDGFKCDYIYDDDFYKIMLSDIEYGAHINFTRKPQYFTNAYFHHPDKLKEEIESVGFKEVKIVAVEGFSNCIVGIEGKIKDERYLMNLLECIKKTEEEKSILGISSHLIGIGKK